MQACLNLITADCRLDLVGSQQKSITTFAANSYTPSSVSEWRWDDFLRLLKMKQRNRKTSILWKAGSRRQETPCRKDEQPGVLNRVSKGQQIAANVESFLSAAEQGCWMGVELISDDIGLKANADLRVCGPKPSSQKIGLSSPCISPEKRSASRVRVTESFIPLRQSRPGKIDSLWTHRDDPALGKAALSN
jgi:hypothetical protein